MGDVLNYILTHEDAFRKNRLPSLYSDFTLQKRTNPDGYDVNVAAWEHALTRAARAGCISSSSHARASKLTGSTTNKSKADEKRGKSDHLVLRVDNSLLRDLEIPEFGRPVALAAVFDETIRKQTMIPLQLYRSGAVTLQKRQWRVIDPAALSPWSVMSWGMKQLRGFVVGSGTLDSLPQLQVQELVLVENLQETANRVVTQSASRSSSISDRVYSKESFVAEFALVLNPDTELSLTDFDVLLLYLSRDAGAIAYDGQTIRFRSPNDSPTITQQDTTIASIKTLISTISKQVEGLEGKIAELTVTAKVALNNKNRISALSALRSKKLAEHNLKQRLDTLAQLEEVYTSIERAADQIEIVQAMEAGTGVLRALHTKIGGTERVENVVEELREEMSKVDEIGSIISETGPEIDETEIDEELEAMEDAERQAREEEEAEETRKKLAELDRVAREAERKAEAEKAIESDLAESIGKLSQISIEEGSSEAATRSQTKGHPIPEK